MSYSEQMFRAMRDELLELSMAKTARDWVAKAQERGVNIESELAQRGMPGSREHDETVGAEQPAMDRRVERAPPTNCTRWRTPSPRRSEAPSPSRTWIAA